MSIEGIFAMFGFPEKGDRDEKKRIEEELKDFKETPHFRLNMFFKLIKNGSSFKGQILKFFSKADPDLDVKGIDEVGEYMMFTRAYFWIQECNLRKKDWKEALKHNNNEDFIYTIKLCIKYFEIKEEYEKCAILKKIQDFLEKNLTI
jgi:hypothetical protein